MRVVSLGDSNSMDSLLSLFEHIDIPSKCGVQLRLPPSSKYSPPNFFQFFAVRLLSLVTHYCPNGRNTPTVELTIRPGAEYPLALGTVPNPDIMLDWNHPSYDEKQTSKYLATTQFPPFSISLTTLTGTDHYNAIYLLTALLTRIKNLKITFDASQDVNSLSSQYLPRLKPLFREIFHQTRKVTTLTLDEGAIIAVLPAINDRFTEEYVPVLNTANPGAGAITQLRKVPYLPALSTIELSDPDMALSQVASGSLSSFVKWRRGIRYLVRANFGSARSAARHAIIGSKMLYHLASR
ncbi:hypothetical protein H1R20_g4983, partial [Candolleomyces eurysporus]